jgi:hypothetical protein
VALLGEGDFLDAELDDGWLTLELHDLQVLVELR